MSISSVSSALPLPRTAATNSAPPPPRDNDGDSAATEAAESKSAQTIEKQRASGGVNILA